MAKTSRKKPAAGRRGSPTRRAPWLWLWIVGGAILLLLLLAGGASVALHRILTTGKIRQWANTDPEKLRIEYASASGWVPWDIHVTGLELRNRDPNIEFYFRLDDAKVSFSVFALLSHELRFTRVRGSGLDYRLRIRPDPTLKAEDHFAALPPIPGFPERPLVAQEDSPSQKTVTGQKADAPAPATEPTPAPSSGPREDRSSRPFRLKFDDLHIDGVRQVWIDIYRYRGGGTLDGSFDLLPRRHAQVGPAHLALSGGDLTLGKHAIARRADFEVNAVISQFDPRSVRGNAVWPFITGKIRLEGPLAGLEFLNYFIDGEPRLTGGAGTVRLALAVEKGIGKGSLALASKGVQARYAKSDLRSDAAFRIRIDPWTFEKDRIDFSGSHIELTHASEGGAGPDRDWWGKFDLPSANIQSRRAALFQTRVSLNCRDARPLFTLFDTDLPGWARGILKLEGIEATARFAAGKFLLEIENLDAKGGSFRIRGHYRVKKPTKTGAFLVETGILAVGLEIEGPSSKLKLLGAKSWYEGTEGGRR
ncbi:MAG: hypothetical protein M3S32_00410 [Acidobacteriota bacterium]|nr:hypothetical protein [Acidobacteriota bacterium]